MEEFDDKDDNYVEANKGSLLPGESSKDYHEWIKSKDFKKVMGDKPLTNAQHRFAEWLFLHKEEITTIGDMEPVFISIRRFLKHKK